MPTGPNGQKRPADAVALAVMVGRIATGEAGEVIEPAKTNFGVSGGLARSERLTPTRRSEIATTAAAARWAAKEGVR